MKINDYNVYGLGDSIAASKYPKSVDVDECNNDITKTVKALGSCPTGQGHDNFLNGIIVQFDLTCSIKMWTEAQRYHFFDFISSQSTAHCIAKFDIRKQCNKYVDDEVIENLQKLVDEYNSDPTPERYLHVLYNVPTGFELTARMTTNYRQLKTIYQQRKNHKLPEWKEFCKWILTLPYFKELCLGEEKSE